MVKNNTFKIIFIVLVVLILTSCINTNTKEGESLSFNIEKPVKTFSEVYREGMVFLIEDMFEDSTDVVLYVNDKLFTDSKLKLSKGINKLEYYRECDGKQSEHQFDEITIVSKDDMNYIDVYQDYHLDEEDKIVLKVDRIDISPNISSAYLNGNTLYALYEVKKDDNVLGVILKQSSFEEFDKDTMNRYVEVDFHIKTKDEGIISYYSNSESRASVILENPLKTSKVMIFSTSEHNTLIYHVESKETIKIKGDIYLSENESQILVVNGQNNGNWAPFIKSDCNLTLFNVDKFSISEVFSKHFQNYGLYNIEYKNDAWYFDEGVERNSAWDTAARDYILESMKLSKNKLVLVNEKSILDRNLEEIVLVYSGVNSEKILYENVKVRDITNISCVDSYQIIEGKLHLWFKGNYQDKIVYFNRLLRENEFPHYYEEDGRTDVQNIKFITDRGVINYDVYQEQCYFKITPFLSNKGYFTVEIHQSEANDLWGFISKKTGEEKYGAGKFIPSERNDRFIFEYNSYHGINAGEENFISIFTVNESEITEYLVKSYEAWQPLNIKWISNNEISFDAIFSNLEYDVDAEQKNYKIRYVDSNWQIENNEDNRLYISVDK